MALYDELMAPPPGIVEYTTDWRWKRVVQFGLLPKLPAALAITDPELYAGLRFYRAFHSNDATTRQRAKLDFPYVHESMLAATSADASYVRWSTEAMLMTGESAEQIGKRSGQSPEFVRTFEKLFFDIRPYLSFPAFVLHKILGPITAGEQAGDKDYQPKMIGYLCGGDMLHRYWSWNSDFLPGEWEQLFVAIRKWIAKKALIAGTLVTPNQYNAIELLDLHMRFEQGWATIKASSGAAAPTIMNEWLSGVTTMFKDMVGEQPQKLLPHDDASPAIELRQHDKVATGLQQYILSGIKAVQ